MNKTLTFVLVTVGLLGCEGSDFEIDTTNQALTTIQESSYLGPCVEDMNTTFTRNDGMEECTVVAMEEVDTGFGLMCFQTLECEPVGTLVGPSGDILPPNQVCYNEYIGGQPHLCGGRLQTESEACEAAYQASLANGEYIENAEFAYQGCMEDAEEAYELCMGDYSAPHYDCDDFVLDYPTQFACEDIAGFSGLGCTLPPPGGPHAMSVVQQGPPNEDGTCTYAVVEPQAPSDHPVDGETHPGSAEVIFYFTAPCSATPMPPQDILDQRGWTDCSTWAGDIHDPLAGEDPYYCYPEEAMVEEDGPPAPGGEEAPVEEEAPAPIEEEAPAPIEEEAPAPIEEEAPAPIEEEAPAPVEEEAPAPIEEEVVAP